ncbi:MAG: hypothetical protein HOD17_09465 [Desulfobacteraceae bacterium]|nr:hypothetical protein [Desulfobacteraceae bacterium]
MSSILDALKKIEKESPQLYNNWPGINIVNTKKAGLKRVEAFRRLYQVISVLAIVVLFISGILVFPDLLKNNKTKNKNDIISPETDRNVSKVTISEHQPNSKMSPKVDINVSGNSTGLNEKSVLRKNISSGKFTSSKSAEVMSSNNLPSVASIKEPPEVEFVKNKTSLVIENSEIKDTTFSEFANKSGSSENEEEKTYRPVETGTGDENTSNQSRPEHIIDESILKLQAISWSETPDDRIAVINSRIVKEGDSVDGCYIIRIDEDYISVLYDNEKWQLRFSLK